MDSRRTQKILGAEMLHSDFIRTEKALNVILPAQQTISQTSHVSSIKPFEGLSIQTDGGRRNVARGLRRPQQSIIPPLVPLRNDSIMYGSTIPSKVSSPTVTSYTSILSHWQSTDSAATRNARKLQNSKINIRNARVLVTFDRPSSTSRRKISFLTQESTPYTDLLVKNRQIKEIDQISSTNVLAVAEAFTRLAVGQSTTRMGQKISEESVKVIKPINSPVEVTRKSTLVMKASDMTIEDAPSIERVPILELLRRRRESDQSTKDESTQDDICPHGLLIKPLSPSSSHRRSISSVENSPSKSTIRSNSQRMDADVTSMLHYMSTLPASQAHSSGVDEYHKRKSRLARDRDRESPTAATGATSSSPQPWTLRRSVCPVCSQKWRDRSSINNVKYSGLKRHTASDVTPSIAAPARLRSSVVTDTYPRDRVLPMVIEPGSMSMYRSSRSLLSRARKNSVNRLRNTIVSTRESLWGRVKEEANSQEQKETRQDIEKRLNNFLSKPVVPHEKKISI